MKKVKAFISSDLKKVANNINDFLDGGYLLISVEFAQSRAGHFELFNALVVYEEVNDERKNA